MGYEDLEKIEGNIINIQHFSYQDGPGVRTTVFLKGCSLKCKWCSNPESICKQSEIAFDAKECIGIDKCGRCLQEPFPEGAFYENPSTGKAAIFWEKKKDIDVKLAKLCPCKAIFTYGKLVSVKDVIEEVDQDVSFYTLNHGGITVSGGEPLLQPQFVSALLQTAHSHGYSTAIETAMNVPWDNIEIVFSHVDTIIHDIKMIDSKEHEYWTNVNNTTILKNIEKAYKTYPHKKFIVRTPIIPGVNDREEVIDEIIDFILPYPNVIKYELLPYHRLGLGKYEVVGKEYELTDLESLSENRIKQLREHVAIRFGNRDIKADSGE